MSRLALILSHLLGDTGADRAVPPTGFTANLVVATAAAMAFLAIFALALSAASGRLADRWASELAQSSTLRISAPAAQMEAQVAAALRVLETTPGVASARALTAEEQQALLESWLGPDIPVDRLPIPALIEIIEDGTGYDATGLRARLQAEVPGAVLDDHTRWREPLVRAASRLRSLGWFSLLLIAGATAAMITLAARAALAANTQVIGVLRLIGARDTYIARAFVRRFTLRTFWGAVAGTVVGILALLLLPRAETEGNFLTNLGFQGAGWLVPLSVPFLAAGASFLATRAAAFASLRART